MARLRSYRAAVAGGLLLGLWLGLWGLGRILARDRRPDPPPDGSLLAAACWAALEERLPHPKPTRFGSFKVRAFGGDHYRLVSRLDQEDGGRARFACDARGGGGSWEVTQVTIIQW